MRLIIDTLGAPATSGGMRLHATEMLRAWSALHPDDDVVVIGGGWTAEIPLGVGFRFIRWPNSSPIARALGQQIVVPLVYLATRRDRLLATNSVVSLLIPASRATVVAHDWRHLRNPGEFSRFQRAYRKNWLRSARRAARVAVVSEKTARETRRLVDPGKVVVVENGRDHAARWPAPSLQRPDFAPTGRYLLTYGQHTNKRPELVIRALGSDLLPEDVTVVVVGVNPDTASRLEADAEALGVADRIELRGYVAESEYRWLVTNAAAIALVSSDEGFGLPLAEAAALGVPAVVASDSGVASLFERSAIATPPDPASVAAALAGVLSGGAAPAGTAERTWGAVVDDLRDLLEVPIGD